MTTNHHRHHQQETTSPGNVPSHRHLTHLTSTTKSQFYSNVPSYPSLVITQPTTLSPLIGSIPTNTHGSTPVPENLDLLAETDWYDYGGHYFCFCPQSSSMQHHAENQPALPALSQHIAHIQARNSLVTVPSRLYYFP